MSHNSTKKTLTGTLSRAEATILAKRSGGHATVYDLQRDPQLKNKDIIRSSKSEYQFPFVGGSNYKGEWNNDKKEGYGTQENKDGTKYEGEWKANKYHGRGTMYIRDKKKLKRQFVGVWTNGRMEGEGSYYYENGEIYRGYWKNNLRCGQGKLEFLNGDIYIGEWENNVEHGNGSLFVKNGNVYEGLWMNGMKEGPGKFFYASTNKVYEGEWASNQPKCGEYRPPTSGELDKFGKSSVRTEIFKLPECGLKNSMGVLNEAITKIRHDNVSRRGLSFEAVSEEVIESARKMFDEIDSSHSGVVSMWALGGVFSEFGLTLTPDDTKEILNELELGANADISFAEVVDIATFLINSISGGGQN